MVYISFREKRGRCKKMNTFLKRNRCIDTETGISEWFRSICNLQTQTGLIPTVVTSVWQHVTHLKTRALSPTHTRTHTPPCLTARHRGCLLGAQVTADQTLWKPLSHTHSPSAGLRRRYRVAGSAPARLGAGGGL